MKNKIVTNKKEQAMKMLKLVVITLGVLAVATTAQAIKVHQRLFMMTNQLEAARSVGMVEMNEAEGLTNGVPLADGTVAVYTNGLLYVYHTGVWQKVAGQGGTITEIVGDDGIDAVKTGESVELDVAVGNGVIIDGNDKVAVGDGNGIVVNASDVAVGDGDGIVVNASNVAVGQGDGIQVNANDVAVDSTVVRTFGDQNITGNKTFSDILVTNLTAINETVHNIVVSNTALVATNLTLQGVLDMGNNQITNLAPASRGDMAVNYTQLTNAVQGTAADLYVNVSGDTMTGPLTINAAGDGLVVSNDAAVLHDLTVGGKLTAHDLYAVNETVLNITVSNMALVATNLSVQGIIDMNGNRITNLADGVETRDAVNKGQLDAAINTATNNVTLQEAYENGNEIATSAGEGNVVISGSEKLDVSATGGVDVNAGGVNVDAGGVTVNNGGVTVNNAGHVTVDGTGGSQLRMNGANESVRVNGAGKMEIWSGGSVALEFE